MQARHTLAVIFACAALGALSVQAARADSAPDETINVGPTAKGGSAYTPNQSTYRANEFRETNGPSFRVIVDVGNWDNSRAVNLPGESGDPDSPHYRDLAQMWLDGESFPLLYTRAAVEQATEKRIHLVPGTSTR